MAAFAFFAAGADAKTFKPTRFDDPKPDACKADDCSLREAVKAAKDKGKVKLSKGTYKLKREKELKLKAGADIKGKGVSKTTIDGLDSTRILRIRGEGETSIDGVRLTRGFANVEFDGSGGAMLIEGGDVTISDAAITDSEAEFRGGGFESQGANVALDRVEVSGNVAGTLGGGALLENHPDAGTQSDVTIFNSTFEGNSAAAHGAVMVYGANAIGGQVAMIAQNSTFAENQATAQSGGVGVFGDLAEGYLEHVSVGFNVSDSDGTGDGNAGGIYEGVSGAFNVQSSIVVGNTAEGLPDECGTGTYTGINNVFGAGVACSIPPQNQITAVPVADPPADNGGPTRTMALLPGSPALGYADAGLCPDRDQRGELRPDDCDSGAFELDPPLP
ncbi:MAG TPA: choice-of-anchor Q domain-containing protein [Solirubrobacterales bacterium]|nr:choice-of-anchor Q domain-containing protein [Solirubrobacterales bacterium]